ncbi:MAG: tetratricopeptide repeat protein, partial [Betaproteobacteria bacterium]
RGNTAEATEYYIAAARGGLADAEWPAGRLLVAVGNPRRNLGQGVYWLDRAAAREKIEAVLILANIFDKGAEVPRDALLAAGYFRRAADLGDIEAAYRYALHLEESPRGSDASVEREDPARWYRQAAEKGHPGAQFRLARRLQSEGGAALKEAVAWYRKAAEAGQSDAQMPLAIALDEGRGTASSPEEAIPWYLKAAEAGNAEAMYRLALLYDRGRGTRADFGRARDYYSRAAARGHKEAERVLQRMVGISAPEGVQLDPFKGMR